MKLRLRLSLVVTAVTASALLASFASVAFMVRRDELRDLDHALLILAHRSARITRGDDPALPDGATEVPEDMAPTTRYVAVYDHAGTPVAATRSFVGEAPSLAALGAAWPVPAEGTAVNLSVAGVALRGVLVPTADKKHALLYAASRRTVDDDTRFIGRLLTGIFLAATGLTSLVALWLGGRLAGDVDAIARVARAVAEGRLDARVGGGGWQSTETRTLASDLDHMIDRLGELVAAQRRFVSHAAHELRSPLTTLRGELQLALRRPREAAEYRQTIEDALREVEALTLLAQDLLTLARVEAEGAARQSTPIEEAVQDALRMARGLAAARGVVLRPELADASPLPRVMGSRSEIARALRNLVDNAVTHSPEGGTVTITLGRDGDHVRIAVTDEGAGISPADAPHVFAPFYRGSKDQSGDDAGAGLGLSIARGIARRCGGDVTLDDGHVDGARLVLVLVTVEG